MLKKGSKLYSILTGTCPKCQNENMYANRNPYIVSETLKMHDHCGHCGLRYKMEPNFFFGAMFVSYAVAVLAAMFIFAISFLLLENTISTSFIAIFIGLIVLMPLISRISRNIYINLFVNYNKDASKRS